MNRLVTISVIVLIGVGVGYIGAATVYFNSDTISGNNSVDTEYEHTYVSHSNAYDTTVYEKPPESLSTITETHNERLRMTEYKFNYHRSHENFLIDFTFSNDPKNEESRADAEYKTEDSITTVQSYRQLSTLFIRQKQADSDWTYQLTTLDSSDSFVRTGSSEMSSLKLNGTEFVHTGQVEKGGTIYYIYTLEVVNENKFAQNFEGKNGESIESASGELAVSEYGIVTSVKMDITTTQRDMEITYDVLKINEDIVSEPIWISEAREKTNE